MKYRHRFASKILPLIVAAITAGAGGLAPVAFAIDATWNGATSNDYKIGTNWSGGLVPAPAGTSTFNNAGNGNTSLIDTTTTINIIKFDTANAAAYTLGVVGTTDVITLDSNFAGGVITMTSTVANSERINSNLVLGNVTGASPGSSGNYTFSNLTSASGPTLTLAGNISGYTGGTSGAETLTLTGPGMGVISGNISNGGATTFGITVNSGNWTLSGTNSFSGTTFIQDGITYTRGVTDGAAGSVFKIGSDGALGNGVLDITNATAAIQATNGDRSVTQTFVLGNNSALFNGSNRLAITGRFVFGGTGTATNNIVAGKNLTLGGFVDIRNTAGTRTVTFAGSGATNISGVIENSNPAAGVSATGSLTYAGTGTLTLSGFNTYTGTTTVTSGTLSEDFSASSNAASGTNIIAATPLVLGGGTLAVKGGGVGATNSQAFATTSFSTNTASALRVNQNGATTENVTLGAITRNSGGTVDFTLPTGGSISSTSTSSTGTNKINGNGLAYSTVDATTWATNSSGTIGALAAGAYQTDTFAASGDTDITANDSPAAFTNNTLRFNTANKTLTLNSSGVSTVTAGGILVTSAGAGSVIASGGGSASLRPGATGNEVIIHDYGTLDVQAPVVNNGTSKLTVTGTGATTLSATNTYTGATALTNGSLYVNGSIASSSSTMVTNGTLGGNGGSLSPITVSGTGKIDPGFNALGAHFGAVASATSITPNMTATSLSLASTATYVLDIGAASGVLNGTGNPIGLSSLLSLSGNISPGGATLQIRDTGVTVVANEVFKFIQYSGTYDSTTFSTITSAAGNSYSINYAAGDPFVELTVVNAAVPEPETWAMLFAGIGLLLAWQFFHRRRV